MNNSFNFRLITHLTPKKEGQGFTLVELLVALIIVGVLAAVALPNLLGQVGKAREAEGKNGVGILNRAQQAYHMEKKRFATAAPGNQLFGELTLPNNILGVVLNNHIYYTFQSVLFSATTPYIVNVATPRNGINDGIRGFSGTVAYEDGRYISIVCVSNEINGFSAAPFTNINIRPVCNNAGSEVK